MTTPLFCVKCCAVIVKPRAKCRCGSNQFATHLALAQRTSAYDKRFLRDLRIKAPLYGFLDDTGTRPSPHLRTE